MNVEESFFLELLSTLFRKQSLELSSNIQFKKLYELSSSQEVVPLIYHALRKNSFPIKKLFWKTYVQHVSETVLRNCVEEDLEHLLCNLPVSFWKGRLCAECYPQPLLRTRGDTDLIALFSLRKNLRNKFKQESFSLIHSNSNTDVFSSWNLLFEVHYVKKDAFDPLDQILYEMLFLEKDSCSFKTHHYASLIAHFSNHLISGGAGIRFLLDIALYGKSNEINAEELKQLLTRLKLVSLYGNLQEFIQTIFKVSIPEIEHVGTSVFNVEEKLDELFRKGHFGFRVSYSLSYKLWCLQFKNQNISKFSTYLNFFFPTKETLLECEEYATYIHRKVPILIIWGIRFFAMTKRFFKRKKETVEELSLNNQIAELQAWGINL